MLNYRPKNWQRDFSVLTAVVQRLVTVSFCLREGGGKKKKGGGGGEEKRKKRKKREKKSRSFQQLLRNKFTEFSLFIPSPPIISLPPHLSPPRPPPVPRRHLQPVSPTLLVLFAQSPLRPAVGPFFRNQWVQRWSDWAIPPQQPAGRHSQLKFSSSSGSGSGRQTNIASSHRRRTARRLG